MKELSRGYLSLAQLFLVVLDRHTYKSERERRDPRGSAFYPVIPVTAVPAKNSASFFLSFFRSFLPFLPSFVTWRINYTEY